MTSQKMKEIADECKQSIHQREPIVHMTHLLHVCYLSNQIEAILI
jgi:hypothetical protein